MTHILFSISVGSAVLYVVSCMAKSTKCEMAQKMMSEYRQTLQREVSEARRMHLLWVNFSVFSDMFSGIL